MAEKEEFERWIAWYASPKVKRRQRRLAKMPDWMLFGLYHLTQPIMHSSKKPGPCRLPLICEEHSWRIS